MHIIIVIITKPVAAIVHAYCTYLLCIAGQVSIWFLITWLALWVWSSVSISAWGYP